MPSRAARAGVLVLTLVLGLGGPLATGAGAGFLDTAVAAGLPVSTATLAPPTGLTADGRCVLLAPRVDLSWVATSSTFATGYAIYRRTGTGTYTKIADVSGRTVTTHTDLTVSAGTSYSYVVHAIRGGWSTASAGVAVTTPGLCL